MKPTNTPQNTGNVIGARASRRPVCSTVWFTTSAATSMNFAEMTQPAHKHLGHGAGITYPIERPKRPM